MSENIKNKQVAMGAENDEEAVGAGAGGDQDESSVTMVDVLNEQHELEENAAAVLGASDEKCCTYPEGYVKRQALYSCLTCNPEGRSDLAKCAGVCLACSLKCHENHELVELYTKREFRCDCPTERIPGQKCSLVPAEEKLPLNSSNSYSKNFQGLYCKCNRPYPDPESAVEDDMMQCVICEDWYHMRHVEASPPAEDLYEDVICGGCMAKHEVLRSYSGLAVKDGRDDKLKSDLDKSISDILNMSQGGNTSTEDVDVEDTERDEPEAKKAKIDESDCKRPKCDDDYQGGVIYLTQNWRESLCRCDECIQTYKSSKLSYLLDKEDSLKCYEMKGLAKRGESAYDTGMNALLGSMDRTQQIDALTEYNRMKEKLMEFLHTFVASKKVVTEEDINRFFAQMKNDKNRHVGQPHFCR